MNSRVQTGIHCSNTDRSDAKIPEQVLQRVGACPSPCSNSLMASRVASFGSLNIDKHGSEPCLGPSGAPRARRNLATGTSRSELCFRRGAMPLALVLEPAPSRATAAFMNATTPCAVSQVYHNSSQVGRSQRHQLAWASVLWCARGCEHDGAASGPGAFKHAHR